MTVATTARLALRRLTEDDAPFVAELVNDPDWLRFIGDRGVRTLEDARGYIRNGPLAMYAREGFGLLAVVLRGSGEPVGLCGLIRREGLPDVDLGFAFLPRHRGRGYARESAIAMLDHARDVTKLARVVAIASPDNDRSIRLLRELGFRDEGMVAIPGDDATLCYFVRELAPALSGSANRSS